MKAWAGLAILVCALAAMTVPAGVAAKPGYEVFPGRTTFGVWFPQRAGLLYSLSADDQQRVRLGVNRELFSATEYLAKGHVSSKRIKADFGEFGRVDIRIRIFRSQRERSRGGQRCNGRAPLNSWGSYSGVLEFAGEGNVPSFSSKRGRLLIARHFPKTCRRKEESQLNAGRGKRQRPTLEIGQIHAEAQGGGRTTIIEAFSLASTSNPAEALSFLFGAAFEKRGDVRISRSAAEIFGQGILMSRRGSDPETVRVEGEGPFVGRALFSRSPRSVATWEGDLRARVPGAAPIPLAGPEFTADLCRGSTLEEIDRCTDRRGLLRPFLYGSGSHSQPLALARLSSLR